jgi:RING finger/CHY zinc finger protein 1
MSLKKLKDDLLKYEFSSSKSSSLNSNDDLEDIHDDNKTNTINDAEIEELAKKYELMAIKAEKQMIDEKIETSEEIETEQPTDDDVKGCKHYNSNCSIISPCCEEKFNCFRCHDENNEYPKDEHKINKYEIKYIVCNICNKTQEPKQECESCEIKFSEYFCKICNLFSDIGNGKFHCDKCNICRVGNKEEYFHCETCACCLRIELKENHKCFPNILERDCPVCLTNIYTSQSEPCILKCNHAIHRPCLSELLKTTYKCPICIKSMVDMSHVFASIDEEISRMPMPPGEDKDVKIYCYDCEKKTDTKDHYYGIKCLSCGSYNTTKCN